MTRRPTAPSPAPPPAKPATARSRTPTRGASTYDLDRSIGYLLNRAANIIAARFSDDLKAHNVNLQAWRVLAALGHQKHQTLTDLANHTGAELSYLSRLVSNVEQQGLVKRLDSTADKRSVLLALTPAGQTLLNKLSPLAVGIEKTSMTGVSSADVKTTMHTLHAVYHNLVDGTETSSAVNRKLTVARRVRQRSQAAPE